MIRDYFNYKCFFKFFSLFFLVFGEGSLVWKKSVMCFYLCYKYLLRIYCVLYIILSCVNKIKMIVFIMEFSGGYR